ncbi:nuclease-related domain-containing protein [Clostridium sp. ATCC 25772]|uniref:nuclease-related domain-containing protein n=1 Tax=Clostridium sp. ATCC 25772 TaxID=1676991 RepID=UPI00078559B9|nr:nuclease-related domain-containing protein [Clostridium sp. ATCC 25772]
MATILKKKNRLKRHRLIHYFNIIFNIIFIYLFLYLGTNIHFLLYLLIFPSTFFIYILNKKIKKLNSGIKGEDTTLQVLKKLKSSYTVLSDLKIKSDHNSAQIDTIVIGKNGVFIIETKNIFGFICGNGNDKTISISNKYYSNGKTNFKMYNPCRQVKTHIKKINKILKNLNVDCNVDGIIYFTNPNANVIFKSTPLKIFLHKTSGGYDMLNYISNSNKGKNLTKKEQSLVINVLKKYL